MKQTTKTIISIFILSFSIMPAFAHPHVYIDLSLEFAVDEDGIAGFWENWTILRQFGKSLAEKFDTDGNGVFNPAETKMLKDSIFSNAQRYNYYTYVDINGRTHFPSKISGFSAALNGEHTVFRFFVPLKISAQQADGEIELTVHDLSRYVSFGLIYIDDPQSDSIDYEFRIERNGNFYSHSCDFGNAVILISFYGGGTEAVASDNMVRLMDSNSSPTETSSNPFLQGGIRLKDDNPNPFFTY